MRVTIEREVTVGELLEEIHGRYGSEQALRAYVEEHPEDRHARIALHDAREYRDEPEDQVLQDHREVIIPDDALDELTVRRLELLIQLKRVGPEIDGIRRLSRALDRDVKNVSQDVQALAQLGLLDVREQGPGRPHIVSLPGQRIDLHLVEGEA